MPQRAQEQAVKNREEVLRRKSAARLRSMHDRLLASYGPQAWWPARARFEVILGAYLTQNTAWKSVERSLNNLRRARAITVAGVRQARTEELAKWIRPSGFHTRKAPAIQAFIRLLDEEFNGSLTNMERASTDVLRSALLALPGVGPETADAILLYAFGHPVPVADEYLRRIVDRHALLEREKSRLRYDDLAQLTRDAFANEPAHRHAVYFNEFHALVVAVGKAHCGRTPDCEHCPLRYDLKHRVTNARL